MHLFTRALSEIKKTLAEIFFWLFFVDVQIVLRVLIVPTKPVAHVTKLLLPISKALAA